VLRQDLELARSGFTILRKLARLHLAELKVFIRRK